MPGATLPNMSIVLPSLGGDSGIWDSEINDALGLIDVHDHSTGKGVRVPVAGLNINADVSLGTTYGLTNVNRISFASVAAPATNKSLYVDTSHNLVYRSNAGATVRITNGGQLDVASVAGTFSGDFVSAGYAVAVDDSNQRYPFKKGSNWARGAFGGVQLAEFNTSETLFVNLLAPAALGASYDLTFATALPGSTQLVQVSSAGLLSYSNTLGAITASTLTSSGQTLLTGSITPTTLTGSQNDYNPTGLSGASVIHLATNSGSAVNLTGLAGGVDGRIIVIHTLQAGAGALVLKQDSGSSSAANRFMLPSASDVTLPDRGTVTLLYSTNIWILMSKNF